MSRRGERKKRRSAGSEAPASDTRLAGDPAPLATEGEPAEEARASDTIRVDRSYIAVFAAALLVRIAVAAELGNTPLFRTPELDSREYWSWAERIAAGRFDWPVPPAHGPGYPYFLGGLLALFDGSAAAVRLIQAALGALLCVVVTRIGEREFGRRAGVSAGVLLAVCGPLALADVSILAEGLLVLLVAIAFLLLQGERRVLLRCAGAGLLLGLAAVVRPTALLFVPPLSIYAAARRLRGAGDAAASRPPRAWLSAAAAPLLLAAGCALPILPVALANARASDRPVLIQGHGGMNFYIGNSPAGTGLPTVRPGQAWDRLEAEPVLAGRSSPADADAYFYGKTFREIRSAPLAWLRLLAAKTFWTLQADEIRDTFSYAFFRTESWTLRGLPGFGLLLPLAAAGAVTVLRRPTATDAARRPLPVLPAIWAGTALATCVLLVVGSRYRLPLAPAAAIFAGAGLSALLAPARPLDRRRASAVAALIVTAVFCHVRTHGPSHVLAEEWSATGTALNHEQRPADAVRAFDRALGIDPSYAQARVGRGAALLNLGRLEPAREELERAVRQEPFNRSARIELGITLERGNRLAEAEPHYRAALRLDPSDPATRKTLGENLLRQGRAEDAARELSAVVERSPEDASARIWLARAYGAGGRPADGLAQARQAGHLEPGDGEAWLTATMLGIATGDLAGAEGDLSRAEAAGAPGRDTSMARAILFRAQRRLDRADGVLRPLVLADPGFRPAVELFLENARDRGSEREAIDFLRRAAQRPSG